MTKITNTDSRSAAKEFKKCIEGADAERKAFCYGAYKSLLPRTDRCFLLFRECASVYSKEDKTCQKEYKNCGRP